MQSVLTPLSPPGCLFATIGNLYGYHQTVSGPSVWLSSPTHADVLVFAGALCHQLIQIVNEMGNLFELGAVFVRRLVAVKPLYPTYSPGMLVGHSWELVWIPSNGLWAECMALESYSCGPAQKVSSVELP